MRLLGILLFSATITTALGKPEGLFWFLRTNHTTAEALRKSISENTLPSDQFEQKIDSLIAQNTVTELAKFDGALEDQKKVSHEKSTGEIEIKEIEEVIPMGIRLDVAANISIKGPLIDLAYQASIQEKDKRLQWNKYEATSAATFIGNRWHCIHYWRRADEVTLLLTRLSSIPEAEGITSSNVSTLHLNYELLSVSPADLAKFGKSTPATRSKAIIWLRGQAEVLDETRITCRSGEKGTHMHSLDVLTEDNDLWDTWNLGSTVSIETNIAASGLTANLVLEASWQDPKKSQPEPDYRFEVRKELKTGVTELIHPSSKPAKTDSEIIILITPEIIKAESK
ncbi:hypothetical protein ACFQY0_13900 [Haloferula chungangensis]|uniref:Uncharacterized protein n=1 Tax=Haloferula chungangensis TaxID=1048331 RepID=A0ABW2L7B6_9BACT